MEKKQLSSLIIQFKVGWYERDDRDFYDGISKKIVSKKQSNRCQNTNNWIAYEIWFRGRFSRKTFIKYFFLCIFWILKALLHEVLKVLLLLGNTMLTWGLKKSCSKQVTFYSWSNFADCNLAKKRFYSEMKWNAWKSIVILWKTSKGTLLIFTCNSFYCSNLSCVIRT